MEKPINLAIKYHQENPQFSLRSVAEHFSVSRATLQRQVKAPLKAKGDKNTNKNLSDIEEKAVCAYINRLDRINMSIRPEFVRDAANAILKEQQSTATPLNNIVTIGPH
ncbi:hypothetical protein B0I35DRAFT_269030 [Stachybotrys elegans]|uniref:HTH psq-type domain-containing protein n=1 Tax=Stachybotrys elegans TaxID=80388 RepID=A0A8K0SNX7_9HYPO|nr:hypothetical protein B0I35DRAFT_269030 [Stachybotrys elegans]